MNSYKIKFMKKVLLFSFGVIAALQAHAQPIYCGNASNAFSILRPSQNQVVANNSLDDGTVIFIHRQDFNIAGETSTESGKLRYSISTNFGASFVQNVGVLNNTYSRFARYPMATMYNPSGNTSATGSYLVWAAPTLQLSGTGWDGHVNGVAQVDLVSPTSSENYQFQNTNSGLPGGLTERVPGEYWMVEAAIVNDSNKFDSIIVFKGIYNTGNNTVAWARHAVIQLPVYKGFDGVARASSPNIAFSPNGQVGYISAIGDLIGGSDSVYHPILIKTTDGGTTWGTPFEVNVQTEAWLLDTLQAIAFDDGQGGIIQVTGVTTAFDYDITVDANGNPHFFTVVGCAESREINSNTVQGSGKGYVIYPGFPKFACDITSTDGGTTWSPVFVAPVLTFRSTISSALSIDNQPQVSRTEDGTRIFYTWVDTDTLLAGMTNDNTMPNSRIAGLRISDGYQTCFRRLDDYVDIPDLVRSPTMAPTVLQDDNLYSLPIVAMQIISDENNPVVFHYFGQAARLCEEDFKDPSGIDFSWSASSECYDATNFCATTVSIEEPAKDAPLTIFPNPATDVTYVGLEKNLGQPSQVYVINMSGQKVISFAGSTLAPGATQFELNVSGLAAGVYNVVVEYPAIQRSSKLSVVK